jgi:hypothetical protein
VRLSEAAIVNIAHRLRQMAAEIDNDPTVTIIRVAISINDRNHRVLECHVDLARKFGPVTEGVLTDAQLDRP